MEVDAGHDVRPAWPVAIRPKLARLQVDAPPVSRSAIDACDGGGTIALTIHQGVVPSS
jgi:hypothetical protein